jgi:hypothetical protein
LVAAVVGRRDRGVRYLCIVLGLQLLAWLFASHLYARFAVPMLIPLALLVARLEAACRTRLAARLLLTVVLAGLAVNLFFAARLYVAHLYPGGKHIPVHGLARLFTNGDWPMQEHLGALNALPAGAKVLMVGDARTYYVRADCDYCVVFNRSSFAERVEHAAREEGGDAPAAVLDWLREQGYTHVYVNFSEITRLRNSQYGFPAPVTRQLFEDLETAGLQLIQTFCVPPDGPTYGALYRMAAR